MSGKRYAVLDKDGKVVNHILIADPLPKGYWPGYGAHLVPCEPVSFSKGGAGLDILNFNYTLTNCPQIGDTVNKQTGAITKFVPVIADGFASAPQVKYVTDVQPKAEGDYPGKPK